MAVHYLNYFSINKTELYLILYDLLVYFNSWIVLIVKKNGGKMTWGGRKMWWYIQQLQVLCY